MKGRLTIINVFRGKPSGGFEVRIGTVKEGRLLVTEVRNRPLVVLGEAKIGVFTTHEEARTAARTYRNEHAQGYEIRSDCTLE